MRSGSFNLETAVECARVCRDWRARQGETTQWAYAHKAEQRSLARQARCNRAHSALTHNVIIIEEGKVNTNAAFLMFASGQLRFPGSRRLTAARGGSSVKQAEPGDPARRQDGGGFCIKTRPCPDKSCAVRYRNSSDGEHKGTVPGAVSPGKGAPCGGLRLPGG